MRCPGPGLHPWVPRKVPPSPGCLLDAAVQAAAEPGRRRSLRPANRAAPRVPFPFVQARSPGPGLAWLHAGLCHPQVQWGCCAQARAESAPGAAWARGVPLLRKGAPGPVALLEHSPAGAPSHSILISFSVGCPRFLTVLGNVHTF